MNDGLRDNRLQYVLSEHVVDRYEYYAQSSIAEGVQNALLSSPSPNFLICYLVFPGDAQYVS